MAIIFDSLSNTITIHTDHSSYQMLIDRYGYLLHLYYGQRSELIMDQSLSYADRGFSGNPYAAGLDRTYSLDFLPQEFPVQGSGDFRSPMLVIRDHSGVYGCDLHYDHHEIREGKYSLEKLPAVYAEAKDDDAQTLAVTLTNERTGIEATLLYGVLPHLDMITRAVTITNRGTNSVTVCRLASACLDFTDGDYDLMTFYGRHTMERIPERRALSHGEFTIGSRRGYSSHQFNPMMILLDRDTSETSGRCWSMQFVYSGGFRAVASLDQYDQTRVQMGLSDEKFSYPLQPGEELTSPEVIMSFSSTGLETLSHNLHKCIRTHLCRGIYRDASRPLLLNSWEACYFDFTGEKIAELAKDARSLGIDMVVLDDGWFGRRNDDFRSLGDWYANEEKLGCTLSELIQKVNDQGVSFGIWLEPEMISEDSDLYRAHPDWALAIPGEKPVRARNQLVLDLSRPEIADAVYASVCHVLDQGNVRYLKWDCNRSICEAFSCHADDQGKVLYDYMTGLYGILERLNNRYPDVLIEGCSGGGGRFDAGMLYYTPQIWCSDNTDATDRLMIQYGTSFGYPASAVGAHVSACPNHLTGRITSLKTRGIVAMSGTYGFELDPSLLSEEEKEDIRMQIADYRRFENLIRTGLYYRLTDPAISSVCAWEFAAEDGSEALICAVRINKIDQDSAVKIRPRGLLSDVVYKESAAGREYEAGRLAEEGLLLSADCDSALYHFTCIT